MHFNLKLLKEKGSFSFSSNQNQTSKVFPISRYSFSCYQDPPQNILQEDLVLLKNNFSPE